MLRQQILKFSGKIVHVHASSYKYGLALRFSTNQQENDSKTDQKNKTQQKSQKELFEERKLQAEKAEQAALRQRIKVHKSRDSGLGEFLALFRQKIVLSLLGVGGALAMYLFLKDSEFYLDSVQNRRIFLPLKFSKEKVISDAMMKIFSTNFELVTDGNDPRLKRVTRVYRQFSDSEQLKTLNLYFNGRVNVIKSIEPIFFMLSNGALYCSQEVLSIVNSDEDLAVLMAYEIAHIYNRSLIKSLSIADTLKVLKMNFLVNFRFVPFAEQREVEAMNFLSEVLDMAKIPVKHDEVHSRLITIKENFKSVHKQPKTYSYVNMHPFLL